MFKALTFVLIGFLITAFLSCERPDLSQIKNLQDNKIVKIGHGGMGFPSIFPFNALPTNSIGAFKKALENENADGVELDVHMTADYDFVLFHDKTLDDITSKKGYPEELNLEQIVGTTYDLGFPYNLFQNESIISLDSAFHYFESLENTPIIQLDFRNYCEKFSPQENDKWEQLMSEKIIERLSSYNINPNKIHLISISKEMCFYFEEQSGFNISYEVRDKENLSWAIENGISSITINSKNLTKEFSKVAHENGVEVIAFGIKSKSGITNLIEKSPDYIQTDNLSSLRNLLEK